MNFDREKAREIYSMVYFCNAAIVDNRELRTACSKNFDINLLERALRGCDRDATRGDDVRGRIHR